MFTTISELEANNTTWQTAYAQAEELEAEKRAWLITQTSFTFEQFIYSDGSNEALESWKEDSSAKALCASIASLQSKIKRYDRLINGTDTDKGSVA